MEGCSWKSSLYSHAWGGIENASRIGAKASFLVPDARTAKSQRVRKVHRKSTDCSVSRLFQPANRSSLLLIREGKLSTKPFGDEKFPDSAHSSSFLPHYLSESWQQEHYRPSEGRVFSADADSSYDPMGTRLSPWSTSVARRVFDCAWVLLALPVVAPLCLAIAAAVRLTSHGPALFLQERMGRHGRTFTIFKFRTMVHLADETHHPVTTADNQRFTSIGRFLRRWKLDELPQLLNVLLGHMSLVGSRPRMPEHVLSRLSCRPGITGLATIVFADEEVVLARVPPEQLDAFYFGVVLPVKGQLDARYMARATVLSDLQILVKSVLRRWDNAALEALIVMPPAAKQHGKTALEGFDTAPVLVPACANELAQPEQVSAF
jgi:lipopolysaccharide/colanic/teichoic acid biosynthesis glycosyltransferase